MLAGMPNINQCFEGSKHAESREYLEQELKEASEHYRKAAHAAEAVVDFVGSSPHWDSKYATVVGMLELEAVFASKRMKEVRTKLSKMEKE